MFTLDRKTVLTLAAAMAVGSLALVSTDASAKPGGFGGGFKGGGFHKPHFKPHFVHHHHYPHWRWRYGLRRHYWVAPVVATGVATRYVSTPTTIKPNCLTKQYTPQGAVLFKDVCTNEWAMNPPATTSAPAAYDPSQMPSLQGSMPMPQQMAMPAQQPAPLPGLQAR